MTKLEDIKKMEYGDEIIIDTPFQKDVTYVYLGEMSWGAHAFSDLLGASFMIKDDETIGSFNVRIIDKDHPKWNEDLRTLVEPYKQFFDGSELNLPDEHLM